MILVKSVVFYIDQYLKVPLVLLEFLSKMLPTVSRLHVSLQLILMDEQFKAG